VDKSMLFHLNPFTLIYSYDIAAFTFDFIAVMNTMIFCDSVFPTVQDSSFADFMIPKDFRLTLGTSDRQHTDFI
jgi:hypothetical protein